MDARDRARISLEDTRRIPLPQGVMMLRQCCLPVRIKHFCANDAVARNKLTHQTLIRIYQRSHVVLEATKTHADCRTRPILVRS